MLSKPSLSAATRISQRGLSLGSGGCVILPWRCCLVSTIPCVYEQNRIRTLKERWPQTFIFPLSRSAEALIRLHVLLLACYVGALHYNLSKAKSSGHFFHIYITVWCGSNDIRELTEFSTQLDMLIEKPGFKGKVHFCADGGTMQDGKPRSVSFPSYTLTCTKFHVLFPQVWRIEVLWGP